MINPNKINVGDSITHNKIGVIEILGIFPHCGDYAIVYNYGWVYLKNCNNLIKN